MTDDLIIVKRQGLSFQQCRLQPKKGNYEMRHQILNVKSLMFLFAIVLLSYGVQGISYGQVCSVGDRISPGESCTYPGTNIEFSVRANGSGNFLFFTSGGGINARNVTVNGVRYNFAASKQADGTWLIEAAGDGSTPPPVSNPDLVVGQPTVSQSTLAPGENFTLSATVANNGAGSAAATTLRYYRSTNTTISSSDTEVGTDSVSALGANQSSAESITLTAPSSPGTYYYGACVEAVTGESSSNNNCSAAVSITVQRTPVVSEPSQPFIYWTDAGTDKIQRANLDGSNVQDLVTQGLSDPRGIALDVAGGKMYWTDADTDKIQRANLDGSNVQDLVTQGLETPKDIALDVSGGKMYWIDWGTDKIQRANLDGSNIQDLVTQGLETLEDIALDVAGGKMYWTDWGTDKIQRANLDGSNVQDLITGLRGPSGIALDVTSGKMYWTDFVTDKIQRANLDGSNVQDLVTQGLETPVDIALDVAGGKMYWVDYGEVGEGAQWGKEKIQRANLDGSNVQDLVTRAQGLSSVHSIALGISPQDGGRVVASVASPLTEATLDGSVVTLTLTGKTYEQDISKIRDAVTVSGINGVTIDTATVRRLSDTEITVALAFDGISSSTGPLTFSVGAGAIADYTGPVLTAEIPVTNTRDQNLFIYWTDVGAGKIQRANLDGSNVQDLVTQGLGIPIGIALDVRGGKMYWTDFGTGKIQRANLDGSNVQDLVTQGLGVPSGIALDVRGGKMYWTDFGTDKIQRANLDGSNIEDLVTTGLSDPYGIALDVAGGKMYWTDNGTDKIQRANLDGSNIEDLVTKGLRTPLGIALDVGGGKMYWTDNGTDKIQRANLDGSNVQDLVTQGLANPVDIALDVAGGKMYWTDNGTDKIQRANLDGSNVEDLITQGLDSPVGIALGISPQTLPPTVREDVNRDGVISILDLILVAQQLGKTVPAGSPVDVNGDGVASILDLILIAQGLGNTTAASAPSLITPPRQIGMQAQAGGAGRVNPAMIAAWIAQARLADDGSLAFKQGIENLENLLASLIPEETALFRNYPNPFNPETWIPYHLANDTDVSLFIYGMDGALVRELDLGHQRAGYYTDRSRAAYWDGRNTLGEPVASGVYFYQFRAGDYSQMRKMVILK